MDPQSIRAMRVSRSVLRTRAVKGAAIFCAVFLVAGVSVYLLQMHDVVMLLYGMAVGTFMLYWKTLAWHQDLREGMEKYFDWDRFEKDHAASAQPTRPTDAAVEDTGEAEANE